MGRGPAEPDREAECRCSAGGAAGLREPARHCAEGMAHGGVVDIHLFVPLLIL